MPIRSQSLTQVQYQALLTGLPKYCPTSVFMIGAQSYTTPQVVSLIASILAAAVAVPTTKAAWLGAIASLNEAEAEDGQTVKEVRDVVALMFKNAPSTLAELAIEPPKPRKPLSGEAQAAASAKARATRAARGTTSKKQKALVTGNVTGVNIIPVTSSSPTSAATPAVPVATPPGGAASSSSAVAAGGATSASGSTPHA